MSTPQWVRDGIAAAVPSEVVGHVTVTRYPHTYAYDFVRSHADAFGLPTGNHSSRADAAGWLRDRLGVTSRDVSHLEVVRELADAYIAEHHLVWPDGFDADVAVAARCTPAGPGKVDWT